MTASKSSFNLIRRVFDTNGNKVPTETRIDNFITKKTDILEFHNGHSDCYFYSFVERQANGLFALKYGSASDWGSFSIEIEMNESSVEEILNVMKAAIAIARESDGYIELFEEALLEKSHKGTEMVSYVSSGLKCFSISYKNEK